MAEKMGAGLRGGDCFVAPSSLLAMTVYSTEPIIGDAIDEKSGEIMENYCIRVLDVLYYFPGDGHQAVGKDEG
jgi:hypothetical protein